MSVVKLLELLSAMVAVMYTSRVDPDMYNISTIRTVSEFDSSYIWISSVIDDGENKAEIETHDILIDAPNGVAYTKVLTLDNNIWFSGKNTYSSVEVFQDGVNGLMYQNENDSKWVRLECEPFSVASSVYNFDFASMCGHGWALDHETSDEIYLSRGLGSVLGSGYMQDNYVSMFGMFGDTRFTECSSVAVINKQSKRLKTYDETVKFYADELNGEPVFTADDGKTEVAPKEYSCSVHIEISDIGGVQIPEELLNSFEVDENSIEKEVIESRAMGFVLQDFIVTDSSFDSNMEGFE